MRDLALGTLVQLYLHVSSEDYLDLGDDRGPQLLQAIRKRLWSRIPAPPYDALIAGPTPQLAKGEA